MSLPTHSRQDFKRIVNRLSTRSINDRSNPWREFEWPETISEDTFWCSPELLTTRNTTLEQELDQDALIRLSRWESINFYSLNIHGIRELLAEVVARIHKPGYGVSSDFFHHFIAEENEHMWFFAEFCLRYGGKIYPSRNLKLGNAEEALPGNVKDLLVFVRIQSFEEIVDYFNTTIANDESLHPFIRKINAVHHRDESRHIAFGRRLVALLFDHVSKDADKDTLEYIENYVRNYLIYSIKSLYNPSAYQDASIFENPLKAREHLLADEGRVDYHDTILNKPVRFFQDTGILHGPVVVA